MRAAKGRSFAFFFVALSLLASASAFASIPRNCALDPPPIERFDVADTSTEVLPLHDQLARAANAAWRIESLPDTRVGVPELFTPLEHQQPSELSRALHHAYAHLSGENASDQTFCGGDPVNGRDPTGRWADAYKKIGKQLLDIAGMAGKKVKKQAEAIDRLGRAPRRSGEGEVIGLSEDWSLDTFATNVVDQTASAVWDFAKATSNHRGRTPTERIINTVTEGSVKRAVDAGVAFYNADEEHQREMIVGVTVDVEEQILLARASSAAMPRSPKVRIPWERGIGEQGMSWEDYLATARPATDRLPAGLRHSTSSQKKAEWRRARRH